MTDPTISLSKLSILSANVQGFGQKQKRSKFFMNIKPYSPDIVLLSDTRFNHDLEQTLMNEIDYKCIFNSLSSDKRGVAILYKKNIPLTHTVLEKDNNGNLLTIKAVYDDKAFLITSIYSPNEDSPEFFEHIFNHNMNSNCPLQILGGDFNVTLNHNIDNHAYAAPRNNQARNKLNEMLIDNNFYDVFRCFNPSKRQFTWKNSGGRQRARLDMFIASECFRPYIISYEKISPMGSDHDPILTRIDFTKFLKGKSYWRHNNNLLKEIDYVHRIKNQIRLTLAKYVQLNGFQNFYAEASEEQLQEFLNKENNYYFNLNYNINPHLLFEMIMNDVRCESISYAAERARRQRLEEKTLRNELNSAKTLSDLQPDDDRLLESYQNCLDNFDRFIDNKAKQKLLGQGVTNKALGEKPTSYFLNLEKNSNAQKYISNLKVVKNGRNEILTKQSDIEDEVRRNYQQLYANKDENITFENIERFMGEDVENIEYNKLTQEQANELEGRISETELLSVLKKSKNESAPGLSGFSYYFYKFFWADIKNFIVSAVNHSFDIKKLPDSQSKGVISIIPKGTKPKDVLDNWRPLCMLNTFYKLVSGVIAMRINSVLDIIIHKDQAGFVPKRFIGDPLRTTHDVISWAKNNNKTGMLLLIDFKKAYDSISFNYIKKALAFFGFGEEITTWVNILLNNFKACTVHAGNLSDFFEILVGCRQGDPVASPLFLISIEILCIKLRATKKIEWFRTGNIRVLLSLYADDVTIFLPYREIYLRESIEILENFYRLSGLQLQRKKTQVCVFGKIPVGNLRLCRDIDLNWSQEFELLGIKFNGDLTNLGDNIGKKLNEIDRIIANWKYRFLSPLGKAVIVKSLLLSKINHIAFIIPTITSSLIKRIEDKLFDFIWGGRDLVARKDAKKPENKGGLNLPDINSSWCAFKLSWLRRLENGSTTWGKIFADSLTMIDQELTVENLLYNTGTVKLGKIIRKLNNPFWSEVIRCYKPALTNLLETYPEYILYTPIWDSHAILANNNSCSKRTYNTLSRDIGFISDLMQHKNGTFCFMSHDEMENRVNHAIDVNQYISLREVTRQAMRKINFNYALHIPVNPICPIGKILINLCQKGCNKWAQLFKNNCNKSIVQCEQNWETALGSRQGVHFWDRNYSNVRNIFFDNRIKLFYYYIVRGTLKTNRIVHNHVRNITNACTYCNDDIETIIHLFWECNITSDFITRLRQLINRISPDSFRTPTCKQFIFGFSDEQIYSKDNILNLYIKRYIWKMKFANCILNINSFIKWLSFEWELNLNAFSNDVRLNYLLPILDSIKLHLQQ